MNNSRQSIVNGPLTGIIKYTLQNCGLWTINRGLVK